LLEKRGLFWYDLIAEIQSIFVDFYYLYVQFLGGRFVGILILKNMSGHSKWANIQVRKGTQDKKRANLFSKLTRNIILAARGGSDLDTNFKLRLAVEKAKESNVPKDNIERAIAKGSGESGADQIEEIIYEGHGPNGVAILIEVVTDNRNRTSSEVKHILSKYGGALAGPNSVKWMFEHKGVLRINENQYSEKDEFQLELIDFGADDVIEEDGGLTVMAKFETFPRLKLALEKKGINLEYASLDWVAKETIDVKDDVKERLDKLFEALEDDDDVANYYSNAR